jgi:hypothetical protein
MKTIDIAACGMNCALCYAYQREKNKCPGCNTGGQKKPAYCLRCSIANCSELLNRDQTYCYSCSKFPCRRLKQLDKRYRQKYGMSMIENLLYIKLEGAEQFINKEIRKWNCSKCGNLLSVHKPECIHCGIKKRKTN